MLKTLKSKIALVAVTALGAGLLSVAVAPVANAALTATGEATFVQTGSTTAKHQTIESNPTAQI